MGGASLLKTSEDLLFKQKNFQLTSYRKSSFTSEWKFWNPTDHADCNWAGKHPCIPYAYGTDHKCHCNDGLLMKPYLIDKVTNAGGDTIRTTEPTDYKRLMTSNEAALLGKLMEGVVQNGTASALNGRGYTVAGKTGSAEYDENGSSHSWFIGYSNVDKPDLVVAIIVEGGGTGSEAAVPIAADLFDAYYFD